ncbi:glycosyltransferase family 4 protein [Arcticibacter tournemirensis]
MRVLNVFYEINFSGAEIMYVNAAPLMQERGVEVFAVSTGKNLGNFSEQFKRAGITVFHMPLLNKQYNPFFIFSYFFRFYTFLKKQEFDVVHIHRANFFWLYSLCCFCARKRAIRTVHNIFRNKGLGWTKNYLERLISRRALNVIFQTIGDSVYNHELSYFRNPSIQINNWYDQLKFFPPGDFEEKRLMKKSFGIDENSFVIISTGSCSEVKNHSDIIKALATINKDFLCIYLHLGSGVDECAEIELAKKLNVDKYIFFLGNKVNVRDYLVASDVFVMPSRYEGLSIAAIEAMACGLPSILYNSDGLKDLIHNDDNGFLIDPDPDLIAQKLKEYRNNPSLREKKGKNAREFVNANFSIYGGVNNILELYRIGLKCFLFFLFFFN